MNRTLLLCTVLLAGCDSLLGSPADRQPCASSAECPAGQFCAAAGSGLVCWPDAVPPVVSGVTAACATSPCLRDGLLTVEAEVTDDQELGPVTVSLDLDGGARSVAMSRVAGSLHRATLDLSEWPVAGVSVTATATVRAADGARNRGSAAAAQHPAVTRVRPAVALAVGSVVVPTAPALLADGTVLVGGSTGRLYTVAPGASAASASTAALPAAIVHPPAVGRSALWAAAGNKVYAVALDGNTILNGAGYDTGGVIPGPPALTAAAPTASAPEVAFVGSAAGRLVAVKAEATANGFVAQTLPLDPFTTSPVLVDDATVAAVTGTASPALATLRLFHYAGAFGSDVGRGIGRAVVAPLAVSSSGSLWSGSAEFETSTLQETTSAGAAGASIALGASAGGGAVVLADGDVAIAFGNQLQRYSPAGAPRWAAPATLDGAGLTPLALASPAGPPVLLVPTRSGTVHAIHAQSGSILWSASLAAGVELREGTVRALAGARTSTAWFTSADGALHGLVVDGALDASAPWPKAWHDARNTGNRAAGP